MMVFFSTAVDSQAQGVVITFAEYGASNIAIDAKITMQVNEAAISTWAIDWEIGAYLSVASVILKIGLDLCLLEEDDFLGERTFLAKPNASGSYWDCSPDYRVGPNYFGSAAYIPRYIWNYYKQRNSDIEFYYRTVLY